jgi:hypothetical protein
MPAHISHSLFARDLFDSLGIPAADDPLDHALASAMHIGAQGPDIFYHNQRRMPSGLLIGSVLHRKGYGSVSARMLEFCLTRELDAGGAEGRYLLAFISHGVLDRYLHPYINYFSGWVDPDEPASEAYRYCHPFLERILDVAFFMRRHRPGAQVNAVQPLNAFGFADAFDAGDGYPGRIAEMLAFALRGSYHRMSADEKLEQRIANAYADSRGFYRYSEGPRDQDIPVKWAALLHPPNLPADVDFVNSGGRRWSDPCDERRSYTSSAYDLYDLALEEALRVAGPVRDILNGSDPPEGYRGLPAELGDHGLRNNIPGPDADLPCALTHCDPLPLKDILESIARGEIPDHWPHWERRFV